MRRILAVLDGTKKCDESQSLPKLPGNLNILQVGYGVYSKSPATHCSHAYKSSDEINGKALQTPVKDHAVS